jgi:hypothetical protein
LLRTLTFLTLLCLTAAAAHADVIESTPSGVIIRTSVEVAATPRSVYDALGAQVSNWWDPEHTCSGNPRNMSKRSRTKVEMTDVVGGYMRGGVEPVVRTVDQVGGQVHRLKRYIESGPLR